jgi:hypothetical protein
MPHWLRTLCARVRPRCTWKYVKGTHLEGDSRYHSHVHCASGHENGRANGDTAGAGSRIDHWSEDVLVEEENGLAP